MQIADMAKSLMLFGCGAGACALGYLLHGDGASSQAAFTSDQIHALETRLDAIRAAVVDERSSLHGVPQEKEKLPPSRREEVPHPESVDLLTEIRDGIRNLSGAVRDISSVGNQPPPAAGALKKAVELAQEDSKKLTERDFCLTPYQVYSRYGMPDIRSQQGPGCQVWTYRDGSDWLAFTFCDGIMVDAKVNPSASKYSKLPPNKRLHLPKRRAPLG